MAYICFHGPLLFGNLIRQHALCLGQQDFECKDDKETVRRAAVVWIGRT